MFCDHCKKQLNSNAKFCKYCGRRVEKRKERNKINFSNTELEILRILEKNISTFERVKAFGYLSGEILEDVRKIFSDISKEEKILAVFDDTLRKNLDNGFCITTRGIHYKNFMSPIVFIPYNEIEDFKILVNDLLINNEHRIKITLMSERSKNNIYSFLEAITEYFKDKIDDKKFILLVDMKEFGPYTLKIVKGMLSGTLKGKENVFIKEKEDREFHRIKDYFGNKEKTSEKETKKDKDKIRINECGLGELLKISGLSLRSAQKIIDDRKAGIYIKNIYELAEKYNMMPHQIAYLEEKVDLEYKEIEKDVEIEENITELMETKGRIIDF